MKKLSFILIVLFALLLSACGQAEEENNAAQDQAMEPIDVQLEGPEETGLNETVTFKATVVQGEEPVDDADEVEFEIWKDGLKDDSEMIQATHEGNGVYSIETMFAEDGVYTVQSHVTARTMHSMPKQEVIAGSGEAEEAENDNQEESEHEHGHSHINIELQQPEELIAGEESQFVASVKNEEETLKEAAVTFEVWKEDEEKHDWIDTSETNSGYKAELTFEEEGSYIINIHVKKEDIHDHKEYEVEVISE